MRRIRLPDALDCGTCRVFAYCFLAQELPKPDRERFQQHLDTCPPCARFLEVESSFERALRRRLLRADVPAGLEKRLATKLQAVGSRSQPRKRRT